MNLKNKKLVKSLVYDAVGMATMAVPLVGPFLDMVWAPVAARKMSRMYPGTKGKLASAIVFLEEILPFSDVIPTFTLMWVYTYVFQKQQDEVIINAEVV